MKCNITLVNHGNLINLNKNYTLKSNKQLRYEITRNTDLSIHIQNIHKSLISIGYPIDDPPTNFTIRILPVLNTNSKDFPVYLKESGPDIDAQLLQLLNLLTKQQRKKGFLLEFILSPNTRSKRIIDNLKDKSNNASKIKESAFNLVSQIKDKEFAKSFEKQGGIQVLLSLLDSSKGNTIAYTINALGACLQGNKDTLNVLLNNDGVIKLFNTLNNSSILSVIRRTIEVLHHICYMNDTWSIFYESARLNNNQGFLSIFKQLESADLHTRTATLRVLNKMLDNSQKEQKEEIMRLIHTNNVPLRLQKSLSITIPEMVKGLRQFETVSGIILSEVTCDSNDTELQEKLKKLEEEVKILQSEKVLDEDVSLDTLDSLENEIGELCFDSIDFSADLRSGSNLIDILEGNNENSPKIRRLISRLSVNNRGSLSLSENIGIQLELEKVKDDLAKANEQIKHLKQSKQDNNNNSKDNKEEDNNMEDNILLKKQLNTLTNENNEYKQKILKLSETIQNLIKEGNPTIACEHCVSNPNKIFHLSTEDQVRASTVIVTLPSKEKKEEITPTNQIKAAFNTIKKTEDLEEKLEKLQIYVEELQQDKCSIELDKYQLSLEVDHLKNEYKSIKDKKKKLYHVIQNLQVKRTSLLEKCEESKNIFNNLENNIKQINNQLSLNDNIDLSKCSSNELIENIKQLNNQIVILNIEKQNLQDELELLKQKKY